MVCASPASRWPREAPAGWRSFRAELCLGLSCTYGRVHRLRDLLVHGAARAWVNGRRGGVRPYTADGSLPPAQGRCPGWRLQARSRRCAERVRGSRGGHAALGGRPPAVRWWPLGSAACWPGRWGARHVNGGLCFHSPQSRRSPLFCCRRLSRPIGGVVGGPWPPPPLQTRPPVHRCSRLSAGLFPTSGLWWVPFELTGGHPVPCCQPRPGRSRHLPVPPCPISRRGRHAHHWDRVSPRVSARRTNC